MTSSKPHEFARFNMPFELGVDIGIKSYPGDELASKKCLVIDTEKYRYRISLSDLSGGDIASYGKRNQPEKLIKAVRDWLTNTKNPTQPAASEIFSEYVEFVADLQLQLMNFGYTRNDISNLTDSEYINYCKNWISARG
ncbi:MAG TPA: hypothetical protein VI603_10100 [Saprospiraceae bacterium]|nr:hypothetical protein [Saprospiraceae bacterium]